MYVPVFGEERYTIQKKGIWLVQLGWTVCNRARKGIDVICGYANAGRRLKNNMYVAQINKKKKMKRFL